MQFDSELLNFEDINNGKKLRRVNRIKSTETFGSETRDKIKFDPNPVDEFLQYSDYYYSDEYYYSDDNENGKIEYRFPKKGQLALDELPTVQFESAYDNYDGTYYTGTTNTLGTEANDTNLQIPVFKFTDSSEEKKRRHHTNKNTKEQKSNGSRHVEAPPIAFKPQDSSFYPQSKHLDPAPADLDTKETLTDQLPPNSPRRRLRRRQKELQRMKGRKERKVSHIEEEEDPTIPNNTLSDDDEDNWNGTMKRVEVAAEEFRKIAAEEKEKKIREEEREKEERMNAQRKRRRRKQSAYNYNQNEGNNLETGRRRRRKDKVFVPELSTEGPMDRLPPIASPPSSITSTTTQMVSKQEVSSTSSKSEEKQEKESEHYSYSVSQERTPFRPQSNQAVINMMNEKDPKPLPVKEKKHTYVEDEEGLLEALPTIGEGQEIKDLKPVEEDPSITESSKTRTDELPETAHMVQGDEIESIYIFDNQQQDAKEEEDFGTPPPLPISGSAVLDLIPEPEVKRSKLPKQEVASLSEVEDSLNQSYEAESKERRNNIISILQQSGQHAIAQNELLSIDDEGNALSMSTNDSQSIRRRPRSRLTSTRDSTYEGTFDSNATMGRRKRTGVTYSSSQEDFEIEQAPEEEEKNAPRSLVDLDKFLKERRLGKNNDKEETSDSILESAGNGIEDRIIAQKMYIEENNRQSEERRRKEQERLVKEEDERIRQKEMEALQIRRKIELEQQIKPNRNGEQKGVLLLPTSTAAQTTITNDQTSDNAPGFYGQLGMQFSSAVSESQELTTGQSTASRRQRPSRTRGSTRTNTVEKLREKNNEVEILEIESVAPETIGTVTQTLQMNEKVDTFRYETYRDTIPSVKRESLIKKERKLVQDMINDPFHPIENFPRFQVNLIEPPSNREIEKIAGEKYDFDKLVQQMRSV